MTERVRVAEERERLLVAIEAKVREGLTQRATRDELCPGEPMGALLGSRGGCLVTDLRRSDRPKRLPAA